MWNGKVYAIEWDIQQRITEVEKREQRLLRGGHPRTSRDNLPNSPVYECHQSSGEENWWQLP